MFEKFFELFIALLLSLFVGAPSEPVQPSVECGMCGAHVTEWWLIRNDADTAFVEVCHDCYELCQEG